jgi:hypothetical protein
MNVLGWRMSAIHCSRQRRVVVFTLSLACACLFELGGARGQDLPLKARQETDNFALPDPKRVFRLETEAALRERMARDSRQGMNPLALKYEIIFPEYPSIPSAMHQFAHVWPPLAEMTKAPFVCYRRLYFEEINMERYGWDFGPVLSPLVSQGTFYLNLVFLPYHIAMDPCRRFECNSGYCLPGDHVPLLLYPPHWSWTGAAAEAAAIGLCFVIFP